MTKFKAGDTVRYKKTRLYEEWAGLEGTVVESEHGGTTIKITKPVFSLPEFHAGRTASLTTENLELVSAEPAFNKGDKVKVVKYADYPHSSVIGKVGTVDFTGAGAGRRMIRVVIPNCHISLFTRDELELVEAKEEETVTFKIGDKVRYTQKNTSWEGLEGVISHRLEGNTVRFIVSKGNPHFKEGQSVGVYPHNLELIPSFTFADIQVGDKIRRTRKYESGTLEIREGTVGNRGGGWVAQGNFILAYEGDDTNDEVTLELLDRPKPKHWADEKPVGSIALHIPKSKVGADNRKRFRKLDENRWEVLYFRDQKPQFYTNTNVQQSFSNLDPADLEWLA